MSRLDKIRNAPDVDTALEQVIQARRAGSDPKEMFGGPRDWVDQGLPTLAFVVGNLIGGVDLGIKTGAAALALTVVVRLIQRETLRHAFSGAFGFAFAVILAKKTGKASNFFLPGIVINGIYACVFLLSVALRKPLVGVILKVLLEKPKAWHEHPRVQRAMTEVTLAWAGMFLFRAVVMETLRRLDLTFWLGVGKIAMGYPLYIGALVLTKPYVDRRTRGVEDELPPEPEAEEEPEAGGEDAAEDADDGV